MSVSDRARLMFFSLLSYCLEAQSHGLNQILLIRLFYKPAAGHNSSLFALHLREEAC